MHLPSSIDSPMSPPTCPSSVSPPTAIAVAVPETSPRQRVAARRMGAGVVLAGTVALLGTAVWLDPDPTGLGTHEQLGIPACGWPHGLGVPCPTCGMTTAFALAAEGRMGSALACQPAAAVLAVATAAAGLLALHVLVTGSSVMPILRRLGGGWVWWGLGALILGAWAWKIALLRYS